MNRDAAASRRSCELLVRQHYRRVYRFLVHLAGDTNLAEDLTQETFATAWASFSQLRKPASSRAWLHRIAYRKFIDSRRRLQRDVALAEKLKHEPSAPKGSPNPAHALAAEQRARRLHVAIGDLEEPMRLAIVVHYIQGLSLRETAVVLDEPVGTTKWRVSRGLRELKASLNGEI